jgi:hypothetical protein
LTLATPKSTGWPVRVRKALWLRAFTSTALLKSSELRSVMPSTGGPPLKKPVISPMLLVVQVLATSIRFCVSSRMLEASLAGAPFIAVSPSSTGACGACQLTLQARSVSVVVILAPAPTHDLAVLVNELQFMEPVMAAVSLPLGSLILSCSASAVAQDVKTKCGMPKVGGAKWLNSEAGSRRPSTLKPASQVTSSGW